jgi:hypothetical protein
MMMIEFWLVLLVLPIVVYYCVKFGTYAAITTETLAGYIEIKDAGGTTRKLAVVA